MRFWFRLITTFDEVPPLSARVCRIDKLPRHRKHRLREINGVDLKRVPPKSRPATLHGEELTTCVDRLYVSRGSQGLRRPRFSFFRFTCQTAWDARTLKCRNPISGHARDFAKQPPSAGTDRYSLLSVKSFRGAGSLPEQRRARCGGYIGQPPEQCQPGILSFFHRIVTGPTDALFQQHSRSGTVLQYPKPGGHLRALT
jgi:hypothetical protein